MKHIRSPKLAVLALMGFAFLAPKAHAQQAQSPTAPSSDEIMGQGPTADNWDAPPGTFRTFALMFVNGWAGWDWYWGWEYYDINTSEPVSFTPIILAG